MIGLLRDEYGSPHREGPADPLDELVLTILSQNTSDRNSFRAYSSLKERFPEWKDAAEADVSTIEETIRLSGLSKGKAGTIKRVLKRLKEDRGDYTLEFLMEEEHPMDYLTSIKGVGPKTAACVLVFSLDIPAFPVDTHIHRVVRRLGLVEYSRDRISTQIELNRLVPDKSKYEGHLLFIEHGRRTCHARSPNCGECVLSRECPRTGV